MKKKDKVELKFQDIQQSKLVILLKSMPLKQFEQFHQYLATPFFKVPANGVALFNYLKFDYPSFEQVDKLKAYQHVFAGEENYNPNKMNKAIWQLLSATEHFLTICELDENEWLKQRMLMNAYIKLNHKNFFISLANKLIRQLEKEKNNHFLQYYHLFELNYELYQTTDSKLGKEPKNLQSACEQLDLFYLATKIWLETELTNRRYMLKEHNQYFLLEDMASLQQHAACIADPLMDTCLQFINIFNGKAGISFKILDKLLGDRLSEFSDEIQSSFLLYLVNILNRVVIHQGKTEYIPIRLQVYKLAIEKGIFVQRNQMAEISFINIIIVLCLSQEFDYVEDFINQHSKFLDKKNKQNIIWIGRAYLCFHKKNFEDASNLLNKVKFSTLESKLWSYSLLSRTYYESFIKGKESPRLLKSSLTNFKKFIRRNHTLSDEKKLQYNNFILILSELVKSKNKSSKHSVLSGSALLDIIENQPVISKKWLKEKLNA